MTSRLLLYIHFFLELQCLLTNKPKTINQSMSKLFQILLRTQKEFQLGRFFDNQLVSKKIRICELGCD